MKYNRLAIWGFILTIIMPFILRSVSASIGYIPYFSKDLLIGISIFIGFIISILSLWKIRETKEQGKWLSISSIIVVVILLFYIAFYEFNIDCFIADNFPTLLTQRCVIVY